MVIKNAIIESAAITKEDHSVLSAWLYLDYGGTGQGFGGFVLATDPKSPHWPGKSNFCGVFLTRVLQVAGVDRWDQLPGKTIRVEVDRTGFGGSIVAIGHIIEDLWFSPTEELKNLQ